MHFEVAFVIVEDDLQHHGLRLGVRTAVRHFVIVEDDPSTPWFTQQLLVLRGQVVFADDKGGAQGGEYHTIQKPVPLPFKKW